MARGGPVKLNTSEFYDELKKVYEVSGLDITLFREQMDSHFDSQMIRKFHTSVLESLVCGGIGLIDNKMEAPAVVPHQMSLFGCDEETLPEFAAFFNNFCTERPIIKQFLNDAFHTLTLAMTDKRVDIDRLGRVLGLLSVPHGALDPSEMPVPSGQELYLFGLIHVDRLRNGAPIGGASGPPLACLIRALISTIHKSVSRDAAVRYCRNTTILLNLEKFMPEFMNDPSVVADEGRTVEAVSDAEEEYSEDDEASERAPSDEPTEEDDDIEDDVAAAAAAAERRAARIFAFFEESDLGWLVLYSREQFRRANSETRLADLVSVMTASGVEPHTQLKETMAELFAIAADGVVECSSPARAAAFFWRALVTTLQLNSRTIAQDLAKAVRRWSPVLRQLCGWGVEEGFVFPTPEPGAPLAAGPWIATEGALIVAVQALCYEFPQLLDCFGAVVRALYENRIIEEEVIRAWRKRAAAGALGRGFVAFGKQVEDILAWLAVAEPTKQEPQVDNLA